MIKEVYQTSRRIKTKTEFSTPLHDPSSFREIFSPGDTFYTFVSSYGEPIEIEGPLTLVRYEEDGGTLVVCTKKDDPWERIRFLSDLLNEYHGVMRTEAGAHQVLAERQAAFAADPVAQEKAQQFRPDQEYKTHREILSGPVYPWSSIEADLRPDDAPPRIDFGPLSPPSIDIGGPFPIDASGKKVTGTFKK